MTTDTVESVLAEMWEVGLHEERFGDLIHGWADRLAAAHAREVIEAETRVEAAEGLLREALPFVDTCPDLTRPGGDELHARIDAHLSATPEAGGG